MDSYIGAKLIKAEPMTKDGKEGYKVVYPDGYESWSPRDVFENAYLKVDDNKELPSGVSIGPKMVDDFIASHERFTIGDCTTITRVILKNGFVIIESSSCVDPKNYSIEIGDRVCMNKIKDRIWDYLGFLLQTSAYGVKWKPSEDKCSMSVE